MIFLNGLLIAHILKSSDNHTCSPAPSQKTGLNVAFHGYQTRHQLRKSQNRFSPVTQDSLRMSPGKKTVFDSCPVARGNFLSEVVQNEP